MLQGKVRAEKKKLQRLKCDLKSMGEYLHVELWWFVGCELWNEETKRKFNSVCWCVEPFVYLIGLVRNVSTLRIKVYIEIIRNRVILSINSCSVIPPRFSSPARRTISTHKKRWIQTEKKEKRNKLKNILLFCLYTYCLGKWWKFVLVWIVVLLNIFLAFEKGKAASKNEMKIRFFLSFFSQWKFNEQSEKKTRRARNT